MTWVELRVHGVSGTPPEALLGVPRVEQVAGDEYSRFFRPAGAAGEGHVLEGYHWGRFTSGTWRQGLALLLVPFGLVNAAQFMLPRPDSRWDKLLHSLAGACLRALALVLTALFAFTLGLVLIDLVAWRWAPSSTAFGTWPAERLVLGGAAVAAAGLAGLAYLGRFGATRRPPDAGGWRTPASTALDPGFFTGNPNAPTMRMLHLAGGLTVIALLVALTREDDEVARPLALLVAVTAVVLAMGDPERTVTVGFGVAKGEGWNALWRRSARALLVLSLVLLVAEGWQTANALTDLPSVADAPRALEDFDHVADGLMVASVLALGLLHTFNLLLVWRGPGLAAATRHDLFVSLAVLAPALVAAGLILWTGPSAPVTAVALVVIVLTVALAVAAVAVFALVRWRWPGPDGPARDEHFFRPFAGGMTPFLLATLATFVGVGFSAAVANAVAATLPSAKGTDPDDGAATTAMLDRVGYAWGVTVGEILLIAIFFGVLAWRRIPRYEAKSAEDYTRPAGDRTALPEGWPRRVGRSMFAAQGKRFLPGVVIVFVGVGLLISGVLVFETFPEELEGELPPLLDGVSEPRTEDSAWVIGIGTWVLVAAAGYVVAVSRGAIRNQKLRRGINVVWDVFSFWPHAVHPFVPRPYSSWTVIELRNRIRHHLGDPRAAPGRQVVVAAHSQGSLIAYAALLLLDPREQRQVAFLSCGSQLRVIYPRAFPAYVNLATHRALFDALGGAWINLYRLTDPLAGPVLSWEHTADASRHFPLPAGSPAAPDDFPGGMDRVRRCGNDWRLIDPIPHDEHVETGAVAAIRGHSDFWHDPSWRRALAELRRSLTP